MTFDINYIKGKFIIDENAIVERDMPNALNNTNFEKLDALFKSGKMVEMKDVQKLLVPICDNCNVFISYSHKDIKKAYGLFCALEQSGINGIFLDELWWSSVGDYLKQYNDNHKIGNNYDYNNVIKASEYFNMILVDSLYEMLNKCKVFVFIKGQDYEEENVYSPWLYYENKIINERCDLSENHRAYMKDSRPKIKFPLDMSGFTTKQSMPELICAINIKLIT